MKFSDCFPDWRNEDTKKLIDKTCRDLAEHCDSVVIITTVKNPSGVGYESITSEYGNHYANAAAIREYALEGDEMIRRNLNRKLDDLTGGFIDGDKDDEEE